MTREDVLKLFPDATDEQITNLLNQNNSEVAREKGKADKYKADAQKADELQKQLDDLNSQNLSDIEKANKALEQANNRIAELEKTDAIRSQRSNAMEKFKITAEQAGQVIKDDGSFDYDALGQIISDKEKNAIADYEKKNLDGTPNPDGGKGGTGGDEKPEDVKNAESITFGTQASEQSEKDYYVMK